MVTAIILQGAIGFGLLILKVIGGIIVIGFIISWSYLSYKERHIRESEAYWNNLFIRFLKSMLLTIFMVFIFIGLILLWNPVID